MQRQLVVTAVSTITLSALLAATRAIAQDGPIIPGLENVPAVTYPQRAVERQETGNTQPVDSFAPRTVRSVRRNRAPRASAPPAQRRRRRRGTRHAAHSRRGPPSARSLPPNVSAAASPATTAAATAIAAATARGQRLSWPDPANAHRRPDLEHAAAGQLRVAAIRPCKPCPRILAPAARSGAASSGRTPRRATRVPADRRCQRGPNQPQAWNGQPQSLRAQAAPAKAQHREIAHPARSAPAFRRQLRRTAAVVAQ